MTTETPMERLATLAAELFDSEATTARLEEDLKAAKKRTKTLAENEIPEVMDAAGVEDITTKAGLVVKVDNNAVRGGDCKNPKGLEWLRDVGEAGCIKTGVFIPFATGEDSDADAFVERMAGEGIAAVKSASVNHMTLKALIKRKLEEGDDVPLKDVGIDSFRKASVKAKK
jgi:hypothetical protein